MKMLQPRRFHPLKALWVLAVLAAFFAYTTHRDRGKQASKWVYDGHIFGSTFGIQIVASDLKPSDFETIKSDIHTLLDQLDNELSTWKTDSALSQFNASASLAPITVPAHLAELASLSLEISRASAGAFDVTFSPLFDAWGFGRTGPKHVPTPESEAAARALCGYQLLSVTSSNQLQKAVPGLQIVFNAIAPGYAAQLIAELLRARDLTNIYVDVGGEIVVGGRNATGGPWRIGIDRPLYDAEPGENIEAVFAVTDGSVATSGDYRNYVLASDGTAYSHIFDPRIGKPTTSRVASVTVVANSGTWADALATTLSVMGPEEGIPWLAQHTDAEALFIMREAENTFREIATPGLTERTGYEPNLEPFSAQAR
ncbi:MAG: FAD:protein FMN transferase [Kiritimatiellae bacterium]|nr:FAD:protein FMN transferase [Kiritimatiellia bacterium]